jgi:hypothetical protein
MTIPDLNDLSLGTRIALTFVIVLIILFSLALFGFFTGAWDQAQGTPGWAAEDRGAAGEPPISKFEEHLLALDHEALDKAYKDHIGLVFGVWMKGPSDPDSPRRAGLGARNARAGYEKSMLAIEARERRLKEGKP